MGGRLDIITLPQKESGKKGEKGDKASDLVDVSNIFYFFCSGEGKGVRKGVGGVGFFIGIPGGGASPRREEEGGAEGPGGCLRGNLGGGGG